jgi:hypothetical protein
MEQPFTEAEKVCRASWSREKTWELPSDQPLLQAQRRYPYGSSSVASNDDSC